MLLYSTLLPAFVAKGIETLPPRGKKDETGALPEAKPLPGRFYRCAAAWALATVDSLEWSIANDIEYREKKAEEARSRAGAT